MAVYVYGLTHIPSVHHVVNELSGSNKAVVAVPAYQWFGFDSRCLMSFLTIFFNLPSFYLQCPK